MRSRKPPGVVAILIGISCATSAVCAQSQTNASPQNSPPNSAQSPARPTNDADLAITATVTARELRFDVVPNPTVEFTGRQRRDTVWEAERQNLPRPVQPGVTYRDVGIRLRITSVFADIDRIVAEALGERPMTDDAAPPPNESSPPSPPKSESDPLAPAARRAQRD